jgi:serine/threonine-protein kinase RsbW
MIHHKSLDKNFAHDIELVVSEACTNAILHAGEAYPGEKIEIAFKIQEDRLTIDVKDRGSGFDFEAIPLPDFENHPEDGYGLYIIKEKMDQVSYQKGESYNILSMTKFFNAKSE